MRMYKTFHQLLRRILAGRLVRDKNAWYKKHLKIHLLSG